MKGKRLFWASIIVVELVLVYVLWRPGRQHFARPVHRNAPTPVLTHEPEAATATSPAPAPPSAAESKEPKTPRGPVAKVAKPKAPSTSASAPPAKNPLSPVESFWCQMSTIDSNCNCKGADERAANAPMQYSRPAP